MIYVIFTVAVMVSAVIAALAGVNGKPKPHIRDLEWSYTLPDDTDDEEE